MGFLLVPRCMILKFFRISNFESFNILFYIYLFLILTSICVHCKKFGNNRHC